jgi:outer membrane protein TolC
VGLVLTWKVFDEGVLARRAAAQQYEEAYAEDLALARLNASTAAEQSYSALDVARQALPALQRAVEAGQANYAQAEARFRAGLGTSLELADAEAIRTDTEIQLALGQFERDRARARLARAIAEEP